MNKRLSMVCVLAVSVGIAGPALAGLRFSQAVDYYKDRRQRVGDVRNRLQQCGYHPVDWMQRQHDLVVPVGMVLRYQVGRNAGLLLHVQQPDHCRHAGGSLRCLSNVRFRFERLLHERAI